MEPLFRTIVPPYRLGELLLRIGERRLTGRLLLTSDLGERTVYVHSGFPVFAHSSQFSERLGAVGVRYGIVRRDDVAAALTLAKEQGTELGRALLELGHVDGGQLFRLLGAQLIEQLAASCGSAAARARFYVDPDSLTKVAILRMHPMTAVLSAVRHMPQAEHTKMFQAVGERRVLQAPLPELVGQWLSDLGYMGDPAALTAGSDSTVAMIRSRLVAKLKVTTQQDFDPTASPVPIDARKEDSVRPGARGVADYLTLALLLCGAVRLSDGGVSASADAPTSSIPPSDGAPRGDALPNTAEGLQATLDGALRSPLSEVPEADATPSAAGSSASDAAIFAYLHERREPRTAARMAIWGPAAELSDEPTLVQLLTLYLTLKPEPSDAAVLGVRTSDVPAAISEAYENYQQFLREASEQLHTPLARARIAELAQRIDDARLALAPSLVPPPAVVAAAPQTPPTAAAALSEPAQVTHAPAPHHSHPPAGAARSSMPPEAYDAEALMRSVEARVRDGSWQRVIELVEPVSRGRALPPALSLAKALAERELARQPLYRRSKRWITVAFALGVLLGWLLQYYPLARGRFL